MSKIVLICCFFLFFQVGNCQTLPMMTFDGDNENMWIELEKEFNGNYETNHRSNLGDFKKRMLKCNKTKNMKKILIRGEFLYCVDKSFLSLWTGMGKFEFTYIDSNFKEIKLTGGTAFVGGQMMFSKSLRSQVLLEGKYWHLPEFNDPDASAIENLKISSYVEGALLLQERIKFSSYSYRLGLKGFKIPVPTDVVGSILQSQIKLQFNTVWAGGLLFGGKYQPSRSRGSRHATYLDAVLLLSQDNKFFKNVGKGHLARFGHKWFVRRNFAFTADIEMMNLYTKKGKNISGFIYNLGLKLYLF